MHIFFHKLKSERIGRASTGLRCRQRVPVTPARQMCSARGEPSPERCAQWNAIHIQYGRRWGTFPLFSMTFIFYVHVTAKIIILIKIKTVSYIM